MKILQYTHKLYFYRTLLNRGYANESRNKKLSGDEILRISNRTLEVGTEDYYEESDHVKYVQNKLLGHHEQSLKREVDEMQRKADEMLAELKNDRHSALKSAKSAILG